MDFDPRDVDSRDDERWDIDRGRGTGRRDTNDGDDDWSQSEARSRNRDGNGAIVAINKTTEARRYPSATAPLACWE